MNSLFSLSSSTNTTTNFFNSMLGTSSSTSSSFSMNSLLTDYAMIKNGTYYKLAKAYYAKQTSESSTSEAAEKTALTNVKGNGSSLATAAAALKTTGSNSVFNKKAVTDEETGTTTQEYDTDAIYQAVKNYVDSYNDVIKNTIDSDTVSVLRKTLSMVNNTNANESLLNKIGITVKEDNTLEIDEEAFKKSDMTIVKSLFNGTNSLSDRIGQRAEELTNLASNALKSIEKGTYTSNGYYSSVSTSVGSFYDSIL